MAEWLNHTLLKRIHAFAHTSSLPKTLWGEGLRHATWLKNRTATHVLDGKMPFEVLFGAPPDLSGLHLWGCPIWVHNAVGSKLDARACQGCWIGLDIDTWAHCVYWPGNGIVTVEQNIYFGLLAQLEGERMQVPSENGESTATPTTPPMPEPPATPEPPTTPRTPARACMPSPPPALRCSQHIQKLLQQVCDIINTQSVPESHAAHDPEMPSLIPCNKVDDNDGIGGVWATIDGETVLLEDLEGFEEALLAEMSDAEALEPRTLTEAKCRPDWLLWEKAIQEELATLKKAGTWKLKAPPEANVIGSKWVFKAKKDTMGNITRYKVQLVAQGFSQIGGVNYDDTYAPVAKMASS
jgi:hypothetical protein